MRMNAATLGWRVLEERLRIILHALELGKWWGEIAVLCKTKLDSNQR